MTHRQTIDATDTTAVVVCSCGWRHLDSTRSAAWAAAHRHALDMHPGDNDPGSSRSGRRYA